MSPSMDEKLGSFSSAILNEAQKKRDKIEAEIKAEKEKKLSEKQDEFLEGAYHTIQEGISVIRKSESEKLLRAQLDMKKDLLKEREEIIAAVFSEAVSKLLEFKKSDKYAAWLSDRCEKALSEAGEGAKKVFVSEKDASLISADAEIITVSDKDFLGGVRVENDDAGVIIDYSFGELVAEQKESFLRKSGLSIE